MEAKMVRNNTTPCYSIDQGGGKSACVILADVSPTLTTTHYGAPAVCHEETKMDYKKSIKTYQNTTGALCASGYSKLGTQEAMNDMFVVQPESMAWDGSQISSTLTANNAAGEQHMPDKDNFNAVLDKGEREVDNNSDYVVRRLTPLECERLQGFPSTLTIKFSEMTKDEYIAYNILEGNIIVDTENGKVYGTRGPGGKKLAEPKELKGTPLENGYLAVKIVNGECRKQCRIHRIVWVAANGVIPDGYVIDHINNDKTDNRLCNLQLLTPEENSTKARNDGLYKVHENAGQAKITDETHDLIKYAYENTEMSLRQLSEVFGISKSRVHQIVHEQGWTDIPGASDTARYKALGNSIALPQWQIIIDNMSKYLPDGATLGSLFDGIGGFPLCWERTHGKGTARWASEIEKFPIEVTKYHFPE